MTDTNLRPIDLIAKVAGVSMRRTFYVLAGVRDNDVEEQRQYGKRTQSSVLNAYKLVSIYLDGGLEVEDIVPDGVVVVPTAEQIVACAHAYREMVDQQLV